MKNKCLIVRGLPGSGKSTIAKQLAEIYDATHIESDMYFVDDDGKYNFEIDLIQNAHNWCQDEFRRLFHEGKNIIISNTFTKVWEATYYFEWNKMVENKDEMYEMLVMTQTEDYGSIHGVPEATMKRMAARFQSHEYFCDYFGVNGMITMENV